MDSIEQRDAVLRAAADHYHALRREIEQRRRRSDEMRRILEQLEDQIARDEHTLRELEAMLDLDPQLRIEQLDRLLGGRRLLEVSVELLRQRIGPGVPIHYRTWFDLVRDAGHEVGGKDPLATFLAQLNRAEEVEALGQRSGLYRLRAVA